MNPLDSTTRKVVIIAGSTASGKTKASLQVATSLRTEIVSADARQVFRHMDVGTGKVTKSEQQSVRHHMIDIVDPDRPYSASDYSATAREVIDTMDPTILPLVVGGSGFYVTALVDGLSEGIVPASAEARERAKNRLAEVGPEILYQELYELDPVAAHKYSDKNPSRVTRALEFIYTTGLPFSSTWSNPRNASNFHATFIAIDIDRAVLYERINQRCEWMWKNGLLSEVEYLQQHFNVPGAPWATTVGYEQALKYMRGECAEHQALADMQQATRNYAKRQVTWLRRDSRYVWLSADTIHEYIHEHVDVNLYRQSEKNTP